MTALEYALMLEREAIDTVLMLVALEAVDAALQRRPVVVDSTEDGDGA